MEKILRAIKSIFRTIYIAGLLTVAYFIVSAALDVMLGIKLPQPFPIRKPHVTFLSDPHANKPYDKNVNPRELQKLLETRSYSQKYQPGVFDCSNTSQETATFLHEKGYHVSIVGDDEKAVGNKAGHAWVFVWTSKNSAWAIETVSKSALARGSAGEVVGDDWWDIFLAFEEGKKTFIDDVRSGNPYNFYYPLSDRGGLYVLDWNDKTLKNR
jgi:hypothetical protein